MSENILKYNNYLFLMKTYMYNDYGEKSFEKVFDEHSAQSAELQDELNLNMYAMDMRHYDPAIARWVVQDPVTHFYQSPYSAFDGNPVFWADPSGAAVEKNKDYVKFTGDDAKEVFQLLKNIMNERNNDEANSNQNNSSAQSFDNKENNIVTSFEHKYEGTNTGGNLGDDIIIYNQSIYDKNGFMMQYTTAMIIINQKGNISSRSTTVSIKGEGGKWITSSSDSYAYGIDSYASAVSDFKSYDQTSPLQYQAKLNRGYNKREGKTKQAQADAFQSVLAAASSRIPYVGPLASKAIDSVQVNMQKGEHADQIGIKVAKEGQHKPSITFFK